MKTLNLFPARDNGLVMVENDQVVTTSLMVAEYFGKDHRKVLRDIRTLEGYVQNWSDPLFAETTYTCEQNGQTYPMYLMTRDGFTLLAMGFTGKKAIQFKIAYINAFNEMEAILRSGKESEYAKTLLKAKIETFNKKMRKAIESGRKQHGKNYGPCGDMMALLPFYDSLDLDSNLQNILAFINNSYLGSMYFINEMFKKDEELKELKKSISKFTCDMQSKLGLY